MFFSLLFNKWSFFLKKRQTDYNPNSYWIVTVQDCPKTSPANSYCQLGSIDFSNVAYLDNFLVENSKINSAFLIINE